jgi:MFS family permease
VIGAANALFTAGAAFGAIAQGFVADAYGRKKGLAIAAVLAIIGGALAAGSVNIAMIVTVRILQGCGAGMVICLVPLYLAETAPPQRRGFLSGLTVLAFGFGYEA